MGAIETTVLQLLGPHRVLEIIEVVGPSGMLANGAVVAQVADELVVGADDVMSWGLVFDLATAGIQASGTHPSTAVLVTNVVPGRKLVLE